MCLTFGRPALAQNGGSFETAIGKKSQEKRASRFTLAEWLAMKERNRAMDLWLAANSYSSPYEFFFEGRTTGFTSPDIAATETDARRYGGSLAAYAGVAGLRASYDADSENRSIAQGSLNLRLFGRAIQDTHINLEYGLRGTKDRNGESVQNQFGGVSLNLYLTKYFGLEGSYRRLLPATSNRDREVTGEDSRAGVFIDFGALRIFGEWRNEFQHSEGTTGGVTEMRSGPGGGLRFYF
jgi:hypothetical protein